MIKTLCLSFFLLFLGYAPFPTESSPAKSAPATSPSPQKTVPQPAATTVQQETTPQKSPSSTSQKAKPCMFYCAR